MKTCPTCYIQNRNEANFCNTCGTRLLVGQPVPPEPSQWPKMGTAPSIRYESQVNAPYSAPQRAMGYGSLANARDRVASVLQDMSLLIGEPMQEVVTLQLGGMVVPGLGLTIDAANLAHRARDMQEGIFKVLVLGEFKNGKSTLLNAILGHKTLPAKAVPTTAIITQLVSGESKDVAIYEVDKENPRLVSWDSFVKEFKLSRQDIETIATQGYLDRFQHIEYAKVECLHPFCKNGVKLIDSPGLGEHVSRTRVTTNFLKQAQAVIFVLNATKILSEDEKDFIEMLGQGRLNHVFFVVNRINQVDKDEVEGIKTWVQETLKHHFLDQSGQLDEAFYNRRVFFVNALGALEARGVIPTDNVKLKASGVLQFERELEQFLTSDEKVMAILDSTIQLLSYIVANARQKMAKEKSALNRPLAELEINRVQAEKQLQELERNKADIERTILLFGEAIKQKIYANLTDYLTEMQELWPLDSKELINLDGQLSYWNIIKSSFSSKTKQKIEKAMEREVQKYLQVKFGKWAERIPTLIDEDINQLKIEVEAQVEDFQVKLSQIETLFAKGMVTLDEETQGQKVTKTFQALAGIALADPSLTSGALIGEGGWSRFFMRALVDIFIIDALIFVVGGPIGIAAWIAAELIHMSMQKDHYEEQLLVKIGQDLQRKLQKEMPKRQHQIHQKIAQQFRELATRLTSALQEQINEVRAEQNRIIRLKKDQSFSVEQEKQRLNTIEQKLVELFNTVNVAVSGKSLTPEEIDRLAEGKSALLGQNRQYQ